MTLALAAIALLVACGPDAQFPSFETGIARTEVIEQFGEPHHSNVLTQQTEYILGPIETSTVDMGAEIERTAAFHPGIVPCGNLA